MCTGCTVLTLGVGAGVSELQSQQAGPLDKTQTSPAYVGQIRKVNLKQTTA